jgi:hypothetical protein
MKNIIANELDINIINIDMLYDDITTQIRCHILLTILMTLLLVINVDSIFGPRIIKNVYNIKEGVITLERKFGIKRSKGCSCYWLFNWHWIGDLSAVCA